MRMTPPAKSTRGPSRQEFDALAAKVDAGEIMRNDTHNMVAVMFRALMEPQIGQGDKSLIERMAAVTVDIESGRRTTDNLISIARRLVAVAAIVASLAAAIKLGVWKE